MQDTSPGRRNDFFSKWQDILYLITINCFQWYIYRVFYPYSGYDCVMDCKSCWSLNINALKDIAYNYICIINCTAVQYWISRSWRCSINARNWAKDYYMQKRRVAFFHRLLHWTLKENNLWCYTASISAPRECFAIISATPRNLEGVYVARYRYMAINRKAIDRVVAIKIMTQFVFVVNVRILRIIRTVPGQDILTRYNLQPC